MNLNSADVPPMFLPPVARSMQTLDRAFFQKTLPLAAARVADAKRIAPIREVLTKSKDLLLIHPIKPLVHDPDLPKMKCMLLKPEVKLADSTTWSNSLQELVTKGEVELRPYDLKLSYEDWTMQNILEAILPEMSEDEKETPAGFAQVGHVAHVNLRNQYLPYKYLIGQVLLDKNPVIRTVINKTLDVGTESAFRTFPYEVLAGPDDLDVKVNESGCEFNFNFGKVYWNSRLGTEHERIISKFHEGEAVCDVMAGVGPFSVPAGKRHIFAHANDLNPESYQALKSAIQRNKVSDFVTPYCEDGRSFIRSATYSLSTSRRAVRWKPKLKIPRTASLGEQERLISETTKTFKEPTIFDHYVMNLPATAIEFLDAFKGLYRGRENEFAPQTNRKLPFIHLYLFQAKHSSQQEEFDGVCANISNHLGAPITASDASHELELFDVRLVAPNKKMYCASFRLPPTTAFSQP